MFLSAVAVTMALTMFTTPVLAAPNLGRLRATVGRPGYATPTEPNMTAGRDLLQLLIDHARVMYGRDTRRPDTHPLPQLATNPALTAPRPDTDDYRPYVFERGIIPGPGPGGEPEAAQTHAQVWGTPADANVPSEAPLGVWAAPVPARDAFGLAIEAAEYALAVAHVVPGQPFTVRIGLDRYYEEEGPTGYGFAGLMLQFGFPTQLQITGFSDYIDVYPPLFEDERFDPILDPEDAGAGFTTPIDSELPVGDQLRPTEYSPQITGSVIGVDEYSRNYFHVGWAGREHTNFTSTPYPDAVDAEGNWLDHDGAWFEFTGIVAPGTDPGMLPPITVRVLNAIREDGSTGTERPTDRLDNALLLSLPCGRDSWTTIPGAVAPAPTYQTHTGEIGQIRVVSTDWTPPTP